jgi:hypothetical protein
MEQKNIVEGQKGENKLTEPRNRIWAPKSLWYDIHRSENLLNGIDQ